MNSSISIPENTLINIFTSIPENTLISHPETTPLQHRLLWSPWQVAIASYSF
jgi:hypothetical protein